MSKSITDKPVEKKQGVRKLFTSASSASLLHRGGEQGRKDASTSANTAESLADCQEESGHKAEALSPQEKTTLADCEARIRGFNVSFVDAGLALQTINVQRLYRKGHKTFSEYCKDKWDFSPQRADQLMQAAEVAIAIRNESQDDTVPQPENEGQMRPLTRLKNLSDSFAVWTKAVEQAEGKRVTARILEKVMSDGNFELKENTRESRPPSPGRFIKQIHDFVDSVRDRLDSFDLQTWSTADRESMEHGATELLELAEKIEACLANGVGGNPGQSVPAEIGG